MVVGEEIISASNVIPVGGGAGGRSDAVSRDLGFLFGGRADEETDVEKLERRFWGLLRLLQRKGLLTRDEFLAEVERGGS